MFPWQAAYFAFLYLMQIFVFRLSFFKYFIPLPSSCYSVDECCFLWHAKKSCKYVSTPVTQSICIYKGKSNPWKPFNVYRDGQHVFWRFSTTEANFLYLSLTWHQNAIEKSSYWNMFHDPIIILTRWIYMINTFVTFLVSSKWSIIFW